MIATAATSIRSTLPNKVDAELRLAVGLILSAHDLLDQGQRADAMFGGGGRYEADAVENRFGTSLKMFNRVRHAFETIEQWREKAPKNIDFDALLHEYGEFDVLEEPRMTGQGYLYLNGSLTPPVIPVN